MRMNDALRINVQGGGVDRDEGRQNGGDNEEPEFHTAPWMITAIGC